VVITALDRVDPAVRAMKSGASDYLVKPVTPEALQLAVQRCLSNRSLLAENKALRAHLRLFETCQRIAATLERDKVVPMALAALATECEGDASVLFEPGARGAWTVAGVHDLAPAAGQDLLTRAAAEVAAMASSPSPGIVSLPGGLTGVLLPVADGKELLAVACVVVPGGRGPTDERVASAGLLCRHLGIALRTLGRLRQVEQLAYLDDLTELYNTRFLELVLEREVQGGSPFTVLFLDLDHF
jgi:two-component system cell cycle response regulator